MGVAMAESGGISELLGADGEPSAEGSFAETTTSLDPTAAALAAEASKYNPDLAEKASAYFVKQSRLVEIQTEHLHEQRAVSLQLLKLKRFDERLRVALRVFVVLVATVIGVGALIMIRDAITDHGLVVEAFSVPPDMARDGLTGEVVATRFLDKLQAMQAATASDRPANSYQYNWGSDIKVEIPETGLDLRAVGKFFRERFGHPDRISGEVIRAGAGITVTARFDDVPPTTFTGPESDFDELARKAAEAVYRSSQPYRFAQFLAGQNRNAEAFDVIADLATTGVENERGWADIEWGMLDWSANGDLESARKHCSQGLAHSGALIVPAEICLVGVEVWSGHDEKALEYSRPLAINSQKKAPGTTDEFFESNKIISVAWLETLTGDIQKSAQDWTLAEAAPFYMLTEKLAPALAATAYAVNHDPDAAKAIAGATQPHDDTSFLQLDATNAFYALPTYWIAVASTDWSTALSDARASDSWLETHASGNRLFARMRSVWIQPLEAQAIARMGDLPGAEALISTPPLDCYLCVRVRGQIATIKKDWPTAERWYSEAVRQAPSLPYAFSEWGEMRLEKGDIDGAVAKFEAAHQKTPRFADALKGWGDALGRQGHVKAALAKFDEALEYAPNWKELIEAREAVAKQKM
jgi:tetratricopeptide (TPR) repeat protein